MYTFRPNYVSQSIFPLDLQNLDETFRVIKNELKLKHVRKIYHSLTFSGIPS